MIEKDAVVRALTPLIGEYETLTMERIAQAAGLSEAELLTVFPDKEAVFETWVTMATAHLSATMDPTEEVRRLRAIPVDQPLASRLLQAIGILGTYHERVRADLASFPRGGTPGTSWDGPIGSQAETKEAVARLLRPDSQHLGWTGHIGEDCHRRWIRRR